MTDDTALDENGVNLAAIAILETDGWKILPSGGWDVSRVWTNSAIPLAQAAITAYNEAIGGDADEEWDIGDPNPQPATFNFPCCKELAALRAENKRLRGALRKIKVHLDLLGGDKEVWDIAVAALHPQEGNE